MVIIVPGIASYPHLSLHNSLKLAHRWSSALARWSRKWEKNCCQKSTMGSALRGNKSFPAGIYRADNRPQGHMTTEVGGQIQPPIHTRLLTGKTDPQICFATNSSRKLFVKPDSFRGKKKKKTEFIKDDPKQKAWGSRGWNGVRAWLSKICFLPPEKVCARSQLQRISSPSAHSSDLLVPERGCCPLIKATLSWCLCVCMSGDNYRRTRQITSRAPAMQKSHKQATMTAALDSTCAWAEGPGQSQQTMNIYFPPCVSRWCVNNARPTSEEWAN